MGVPARGPLGYAGTKLGMIIVAARLAEPGVRRYVGAPVNWEILLPLVAYRLDKAEAEERTRRRQQRG